MGENDHPESVISIGSIAIMDSTKRLVIVTYSDDSTVRNSIKAALGKQVSKDLPEHEIKEFATAAALRLFVDSKRHIDLFILDGEAVPEGGMGVARQLKDEVFNCPPVLIITGRSQDNWLATWSRAEATTTHPIDPFNLARKCAQILSSTAFSHSSKTK